VWVGVLLVCLNPSSLSCKIVAKTEAFFSEEACVEESKIVATNLLQQNIYAVPQCFAIGTST
jgi:hypothetical protein